MRLLSLVLVTLVWTCTVLADAPAPAFRTQDAQVQLTIKGATFRIGEPIPYEVKVTNLSKSELPYEDCGPAHWREIPGCVISVTDSAGNAPRRASAPSFDIICSDGKLAPGASLTLTGYLNQQFILDKAGTYKVITSWLSKMVVKGLPMPPKSAPVATQITAPSQWDKDDILAKARKQMAGAMTPEQKTDAVWALAYTLDPRAIPDLVQAGQDDLVWNDADEALQRFADKSAIQDELLKQLREAGPSVPLAYEMSHFRVPADKSLPPLKSWLAKGTVSQRSAALLGISMVQGKIADRALRGMIIEALKDPDASVRKNAVLALGPGRFVNTLDAVMPLAKSDPDMNVREQATIALGWYKNDKAIPLLKQIAEEGNKTLANAAVEALQTIGSPAAVAALQEYAKGASGELKTLAQKALDEMAKQREQ